MNMKYVLPTVGLLAGITLLYAAFRGNDHACTQSSTALDELKASWVDGNPDSNAEAVRNWLHSIVYDVFDSRTLDVGMIRPGILVDVEVISSSLEPYIKLLTPTGRHHTLWSKPCFDCEIAGLEEARIRSRLTSLLEDKIVCDRYLR